MFMIGGVRQKVYLRRHAGRGPGFAATEKPFRCRSVQARFRLFLYTQMPEGSQGVSRLILFHHVLNSGVQKRNAFHMLICLFVSHTD